MKKMFLVLGIIVLLIITILLLYKICFSQGVIKEFEVNSSDIEKKVLIVTQKSNFKNKIVGEIINSIKDKQIYIKIIDATKISTINPDNWSFIVIINTFESGHIIKDVDDFINQSSISKKLYVVTTSGNGKHKPSITQIDSITSASKINEIQKITDGIYNKIIASLNL